MREFLKNVISMLELTEKIKKRMRSIAQCHLYRLKISSQRIMIYILLAYAQVEGYVSPTAKWLPVEGEGQEEWQ